MIKVTNTVTVYEIDGKESSGVPMPTMEVVSHWNQDSLVVLVIGDKQVTVAARDLQDAIRNATNSGRH